jgi:hypothetical protein
VRARRKAVDEETPVENSTSHDGHDRREELTAGVGDPAQWPTAAEPSEGQAAGASEPSAMVDPIHRAKIAFEGFSLSRFTTAKLPANFVPRGIDPTDLVDQQRTRFAGELKQIVKGNGDTTGLRLTVRTADQKSLMSELPGLGTDDKKLHLEDLLKMLKKHSQGTEFRSAGNLAVRRLTSDKRIEEQARGIIDRIKASAAPRDDTSVAQLAEGNHDTDRRER